jgi:hypothetical protein
MSFFELEDIEQFKDGCRGRLTGLAMTPESDALHPTYDDETGLPELFSDRVIAQYARLEFATSFKRGEKYSIRVMSECLGEGSILLEVSSSLINSHAIFYRKYFDCKKKPTAFNLDEMGFEAGEKITIQNLSPFIAALEVKLIPWDTSDDLSNMFTDSLSGLMPLKRRKELVSKLRTHVETYRFRIPEEQRHGSLFLAALFSFMCGVVVGVGYFVRRGPGETRVPRPPLQVIDETNLNERLQLRRLGDYTGRFDQPE